MNHALAEFKFAKSNMPSLNNKQTIGNAYILFIISMVCEQANY